MQVGTPHDGPGGDPGGALERPGPLQADPRVDGPAAPDGPPDRGGDSTPTWTSEPGDTEDGRSAADATPSVPARRLRAEDLPGDGHPTVAVGPDGRTGVGAERREPGDDAAADGSLRASAQSPGGDGVSDAGTSLGASSAWELPDGAAELPGEAPGFGDAGAAGSTEEEWPEDVESYLQSKYTLVSVTAKRARQLLAGSPARVDSLSEKPVTVALEELAQGKLYFERIRESAG